MELHLKCITKMCHLALVAPFLPIIAAFAMTSNFVNSGVAEREGGIRPSNIRVGASASESTPIPDDDRRK